MKVNIKNFDVEMDIRTKGVEFGVYANDGIFQGDCILSKTGLEWCKGRQRRGNGAKVSWDEFMSWMES